MNVPKRAAGVGQIFEIENRELMRTWKADFAGICQQIASEGFTVSEIWNSPDSEVRTSTVIVKSLRAVLGADMSQYLEEWTPRLRDALKQKPQTRKSLRSELVGSLTEPKLAAMCRLVTAVGAIDALDEIRCHSPAILDSTDKMGMTPIGWACAFGQREVIQYASTHRPDWKHINKYCWSYSDLARTNGHAALVPELVHFGADPPGTVLTQKMKELGVLFK